MSDGKIKRVTYQDALDALDRIEAGNGAPDDFNLVRACLRGMAQIAELGSDEPDYYRADWGNE